MSQFEPLNHRCRRKATHAEVLVFIAVLNHVDYKFGVSNIDVCGQTFSFYVPGAGAGSSVLARYDDSIDYVWAITAAYDRYIVHVQPQDEQRMQHDLLLLKMGL